MIESPEYSKVLRRICVVADQTEREKTVMSREELFAKMKSEFESIGIVEDSIEISSIVKDAYDKTNQENIRECFFSNDAIGSLVDSYAITDMVIKGNVKEAFDSVLSSSDMVHSMLDNLSVQVKQALEFIPEEFKAGTLKKISNFIEGTSEIDKVTNEATQIYQNYFELVQSYLYAESVINQCIKDFSTLRAIVKDIYDKNLVLLTDIFGDSIKSIDPEMFDFDSIEFLDVNYMLQHTGEQLNRVLDECELIRAQIMANFGQIADNALSYVSDMVDTAINTKKGKKKQAVAAIAIAGLYDIGSQYLKCRSESLQRGFQMKRELEIVKRNVNSDQTKILADSTRLVQIQKLLTEQHIIKARKYVELGETLFETEFSNLEKILYNSEELIHLKKLRDAYSDASKMCQIRLSDDLDNINDLKREISFLEKSIRIKNKDYRKALLRLPNSPYPLLNILTIGHLRSRYRKKFDLWNEEYGTLFFEMARMKEDVEFLKSRLNQLMVDLDKDKYEYELYRRQINILSKKLSELCKVSDGTKVEIANSVNTLVKLLKFGKQIVQTRLDEDLVEVIEIETADDLPELPPLIEEKLNELIPCLEGKILSKASEYYAHKEAESFRYNSGNQDESSEQNFDETALYRQRSNFTNYISADQFVSIVSSGVRLLETYVMLKKEKIITDSLEGENQAQLQRIKDKFQENLKVIDDDSAYIREVLKQINTTDDQDLIKEGLFLLANLEDSDLSILDIDALLNKEKVIEI